MTGQPNTRPRTHGAILHGFKAVMDYTGLRAWQLRRLMQTEGFPIFTHMVKGCPVVMTTKSMIERWAENRLNHEAMTQEEYEMLSHWVRKTMDGDPIEKLAVIAELRKRRLLTQTGMKEYDKIKQDYMKKREFQKKREARDIDYEIFNRTINER